MATNLFRNTLVINVPNSEAPIINQLKGISDSEVTGFYTNDDPQKYQEIKDFFDGFKLDFIVDSRLMANYQKDYKKKVFKFSSLFKSGLQEIEGNFVDFVHSDKKIKKLYYGGEKNRYLKFDITDKLTKKFKELIIGAITQIVIEKNLDHFRIYLKFIDNCEYFLSSKATFNEVGVKKVSEGNFKGINKIYYGNPGSGKSFHVNKIVGNNNVVRTVFHPDFSNSDFIGQIMPKVINNSLTYIFKPGPFTLALQNALQNQNKQVYLVIEEINRGNASAIFGEIFQLLDRNDAYESIYRIRNLSIEDYLNSLGLNINDIYIPSNLSILATMNTSDQNIFTLDAAFKRRWIMEKIKNNYDKTSDLAKMYVPGSKLLWPEFLKTINNTIANSNLDATNSEDKQLGFYFVNNKELSLEPDSFENSTIKSFSEKVLQYIWEDVARFSRGEWFIEGINTLDDLLDKFSTMSIKVFKFYV
jgi:hypothetical protein